MSLIDPPVTKRGRGTPHNIPALIFCLVLVYSAMVIGAIASLDAPAFYDRLARPSWAPASWVFGPTWGLLYTLMAIALWRVWRSSGPRTAAFGLFVAQLAVNALWSWLFFRWHLGALAFGWIVLLLVMIVATIGLFARVDRAAAALLVPYLGWVGFATALSWSIWRLNPSVL